MSEPQITSSSVPPPTRHRKRIAGSGPSFFAHGEPMVWLTGGCLAICLAMILGMLAYVLFMGSSTFWPLAISKVTTIDGQVHVGEETRAQTFVAGEHVFSDFDEETAAIARAELAKRDGETRRRLLRTGNYEMTQTRFHWVTDAFIAKEEYPEWAVVLERREWGRFYGTPTGFTVDGEQKAETPEQAWQLYRQYHPQIRGRVAQRLNLEKYTIGAINRRQETARQRVLTARYQHSQDNISDEKLAEAEAQFAEVDARTAKEYQDVMAQISELQKENDRYRLILTTSDGKEKNQDLSEVVRGYPANQQGLINKLSIYGDRWWEFIFHDPREANTEGGVWPAIIGTVTMTMIMTIFVVPVGVLAALYLREYARPGPMVSSVRIAINNLAGVPSIVFGVFGLGFFCYIVGTGIDGLFYPARDTPTFGKGGVLWASLTLALLTLPVVIVATEEALAAVPGSMRQGSYACGASKWQTIRRIVLPRAMPGIMTGMILAMARGAGEVAPLMLVGAVKLAPDLPFDIYNWSGSFGWLPTGPVHMDRSFMHLGFHIYDVGFQSPDSEAARPMVFTATMLLIALVVILNLLAMYLRTRMKRKFAGALF